jgi:ribulose kinase
MAIICGTSSCHMLSTAHSIAVPGVWGPFLSVMVPGMWLLEGGQSSVGSLLDHMVLSQPALAHLPPSSRESPASVYAALNAHLERMRERAGGACVFVCSQWR